LGDFDIARFLTWYIALIVALVFHEAAHAFVAKLGGDLTAYESGQVTLNPVPHMQREPFGTILLPILSFAYMGWPLGFAHAPYNPHWADAHPKRAAAMSFAGPGANLLLTVLLFGIMWLGLSTDYFELPLGGMSLERLVVARGGATEGFGYAIARIISVLFSMNLILGVFNLIPLPPLDGAGIVEGLVPPLAGVYRMMREYPVWQFVGMIAAWKIAPSVIWPAFTFATDLLAR